jgi:hypothetical protein
LRVSEQQAMNSLHLHIAFFFLLAGSQARAALSSWDELQLQLLQQYSTPLRWDNVEGPPHWVSGPKPSHEFRQHLHFIHLKPGEEVTLRADANTWLRLAGEARTLAQGDLEMGVSADTRMFVETTPIKTADPYSLLLELPADRPSLIRLTRPQKSASNLVFAAYFSRQEPFDTLAPYRDAVGLPGKAVHLRRKPDAASQRVWELQPDKGIEFSVQGPARLQLVALLRWPISERLREQSLVLQVTLDGANPIPLVLCPELDVRNRTRVNHSTELVSHRLNGFLNVPEGKHALRLQPSLPIYLSVFQHSHPDFLLPWLNGPATNIMQLLPSGLQQVPDLSTLTLKLPPSPLRAIDLATVEQQAWQLARDNQPLDAGAQGADWLGRLGQSPQDYPAVRRTIETLWRQRTSFREILPSTLPGGQPLKKVLFAPERLRPLFEPEQRIAVYNPTLEQVEGMLAEGHFATVPPRLSPGLLYELPARSHDSELRIAAMTGSAARTHLLVQFDQEIPFKVALDAAAALPRKEFAASDAFATLRVLEQEAQLPPSVGLSHPVGEFDLPLPVSEPGIIELPLPQRVKQVRIHLQEATAPVLTSVAYRAAKPFQFSEQGYLALLKQAGESASLHLLAHPQESANIHALRELQNHLLPLSRRWRAYFNDFTKSVELASLPPRTAHPLDLEKAATLKNSALSLESGGQFIEATEIWNRLFWEGGSADHAEAALATMRCLAQLGEETLAAQYARYALLKSPDLQVPAPAAALLEQYAQQTDDTEQLQQLRGFLFLRCPCPQHLAGLAEALALNGHDDLALAAGLILPRESRPTESLLVAALHQNWWQTFDQLVEGLSENDAKSFWRAQKHLAFYRFREAEQELGQSNEKGRALLQTLEQGKQIRQQLAAPAPGDRLKAILEWEQWQSHLPGSKTWRPAQDVLHACSATELVFNIEQNRFTAYLRADRAKPVKLRFLGPMRLQVEARPILGIPFMEPVNDWLEVAEYGITNRVPISQCVPNPGLQFIANHNALVGVKTVATLEYGAGWHEVEVALASHSGLIRVLQEQPVLPVRILPTLNADRMNLVLQAGQESRTAKTRVRAERQSDIWWVRSDEAHPTSQQTDRSGGDAANRLDANAGLTGIDKLRLELRMPEPALLPEYDSQLLQSLPPSEQWLAACRTKRWNEFTNWNALPDAVHASAWLATGRIQELLDSGTPRDALERLMLLLEISELFPAWREQAQCLAELLGADTHCPPGRKKILARLTQERTWVPLKVSPMSAGMRPLQVASDLAQDPSARARRALLPPATTNQFTISGQTALTASLELQQPARLQLHTELVKAGFSPLTPLTVALQVDDLEIEHVSLVPPKVEAGTKFMLSEGTHLVRVWIQNPVVNQFVRISLTGSSKGLTNTLWSQSLAEAASERRFFHSATPTQPVRFSWKGPALLRVDEWRDDRLVSQLRLVGEGEQRVEIPPAPGHAESWYQIFVRSTQTNKPDVRVASTIREPEEVAPPKLRLPESVAPSQAQLTDHYSLGGQEDGTWTPSVLLVQRRPFEISDSQDTVENEFVEANVAYRKVNPSETLWFKTEALGRLHQPGDLTFGLNEQIEGHPQASAFDWTWLGEAFVGTTGPRQQDVQWALHTELELGERFHLNRKIDWYPFAGLFAHYLSLDPSDASQYDYIDQDLYTSFQQEHQWGGVLGNRLEYQPWLDTLLKGEAYLKSNENFSPDDWGVRVSWYQLMGPLRGELVYQFRYFLRDDDRSSKSVLQGVSASLFAEHWIKGRHRIEVGAQFRHDWPDSGDSYFLVIRWDFSQGRHYKDYSPHEMVFRDLRSRRAAAAFNNHLEPASPGTSLP